MYSIYPQVPAAPGAALSARDAGHGVLRGGGPGRGLRSASHSRHFALVLMFYFVILVNEKYIVY